MNATFIVIVCWECQKVGAYTKRRLINRFGPEAPLPDVIRKISSDGCPSDQGNPHYMLNRCQAKCFLARPPKRKVLR